MIGKLKFIFLLVFTCGISTNVSAYANGDYFSFSETKIDGTMISSSNNIISNAIENDNSINLKFTPKFQKLTKQLFPSKYIDSYIAQKLNNADFVKGMDGLIAKFACTEYRFRHRQPESNECDGYIISSNNLEKMPFVSGTYKNSRMEYHIDSKINNVGYYFYLESSDVVPLDRFSGSVHQLGTFFGRKFNRKQLQLSIRLIMYNLDDSGSRKAQPIYTNPLIYFVILPTSTQIYKQSNQLLAGNYASRNAKLLVLSN
ncbi:hypothetical protein MACH09_45520 [Vibrio sp. MACH09]|uniref:hypothetical protein n=1 Tax=Vibrio sp. MACH09 TaxID=3025122 RepID=UPI0027910A8D|nr:hypothetical protein [Vibrio sp. MACH09]GLO64044.1 hypothetical protein MACH09_45520 [Vibrio sp. MACH09]